MSSHHSLGSHAVTSSRRVVPLDDEERKESDEAEATAEAAAATAAQLGPALAWDDHKQEEWADDEPRTAGSSTIGRGARVAAANFFSPLLLPSAVHPPPRVLPRHFHAQNLQPQSRLSVVDGPFTLPGSCTNEREADLERGQLGIHQLPPPPAPQAPPLHVQVRIKPAASASVADVSSSSSFSFKQSDAMSVATSSSSSPAGPPRRSSPLWTFDTQEPLPHPRIWRGVPRELLHLMAECMDARTLCAFAGLERLTHSVAAKPSLWRILVERPCAYTFEHGSSGGGGANPFSPVDHPKQHMAARRTNYLHRRRHFIQDRNDRRVEVRVMQRGWLAHVATDIVMGPCVALLAVASFCSLVVELQTNKEEEDRSSAVTLRTFAPLLAALVLLLGCCTPFMCWAKRRPALPHLLSAEEKKRLVLPTVFYSLSTSPIKRVMEMVGTGSGQSHKDSLAHATFYVATLLCALAILLFSLRVTDTVDMSWTAVFVPLYVCAVFCALAPFLGWVPPGLSAWWEDYYRVTLRPWQVYQCMVLACGPWLVFLILLHLKLAGWKPALTIVEIVAPLWLPDALFLDLLLSCHREGFDCTRLFWYLMIPLPLFTFKLLLCLTPHAPAVYLFMPLYPFAFTLLLIAYYFARDSATYSDFEWRDMPAVEADPPLLPLE